MRPVLSLVRDKESDRVINLLKNVMADSHPDLVRFWDEHGEVNLWRLELDALDRVMATGNDRAIEAAFKVTERKLKELVVHHSEFVRVLKKIITNQGNERLPLRFAPESMRAELRSVYGIGDGDDSQCW